MNALRKAGISDEQMSGDFGSVKVMHRGNTVEVLIFSENGPDSTAYIIRSEGFNPVVTIFPDTIVSTVKSRLFINS